MDILYIVFNTYTLYTLHRQLFLTTFKTLDSFTIL